MAEFLLEIGCEEIPASWLPDVTAQLAKRFEEQAAAAFLQPSGVEAHSTPRRLVLRADVPLQQPDREEQVWGPSLKAAKDASGNWTKAALGFAKKCGVALDELLQAPKDRAKPDELNLRFVRKTAGAATADVLPAVLAATLRGLAFPKRMSWDAWLDDAKGAFPFGRPIRWLVVLLDGAEVPFAIYDLVDGGQGDVAVKSDAVTHGHRFLPRGQAGLPVAVRDFADLKQKLRENGVILDAAERQASLEAGLQKLLAQGELTMAEDQALVDEWVSLAEHPELVRGSVPAEFQRLPVAVLRTVLVHHQKYVPIVQAQAGGSVLGFVGLINIDSEASAAIRRGMERVCVARFRDAVFFFDEDRKHTLESRVEALRGVTFHRKLGSYFEKAQRLAKLVDFMHAQGWLNDAQHADARQAALLCKADLTTQMVREFPELQGVMGGIYLEAEGAPANVVAAVRWHYHPIATGESDPPARAEVGDPAVFGAVSLADKLDTLAGYFSLGLEPTGSSDPYGLRRAAQGAVRVGLDLWTAQHRPNIGRLADAAIDGFGIEDKVESDAKKVGISSFFIRSRLEHVLIARGYAPGEVAAAIGAAPDALSDLADCKVRLAALHSVRKQAAADFDALAEAFKRANNILAGQQPAHTIDVARLEKASERELYAAIESVRLAQAGQDYTSRLRALAALREPVDAFFAREQDGGVMVMADDPAVRANRLALLAQARELFHRIADISKLGGMQ